MKNTSEIKSVGVIGGGTAGYLTAISFKKLLPKIEVTLIESPHIPVIGVGEASTPNIIFLLHHLLKLDVVEFYQKVQPTWKLGIKFFWGFPGDYYFFNPFGKLDFLSSLKEFGDVNTSSFNAVLMNSGNSFIFKNRNNGTSSYQAASYRQSYAYHLDNKLLVSYLNQKAKNFNISLIPEEIGQVKKNNEGGEDKIDHVVTKAGRTLKFDLYIDCSGFQSLLLEKNMDSKFIDYSSTLFTNHAVTANGSNQGNIKPHTLATSMNHGWQWTIPMREEDHLGYVFSNHFCSVDEATDEMNKKTPGLTNHKLVRFRSGRHEHFWKGNVVGIGNSYAFVEPLESTGVFMIIMEIIRLIRKISKDKKISIARDKLNSRMNNHWDALKWFLGIHFKYNTKYATEFWKACNNDIEDIYNEEYEKILDEESFLQNRANLIYYAQRKMDLTKIASQSDKTILQKNKLWQNINAMALPQKDALAAVDKYPELLTFENWYDEATIKRFTPS